jgi:hypothetical protein
MRPIEAGQAVQVSSRTACSVQRAEARGIPHTRSRSLAGDLRRQLQPSKDRRDGRAGVEADGLSVAASHIVG